MSRKAIKGVCDYCNAKYTRSWMVKHLKTCKTRLDAITGLEEHGNKQETIYLLEIKARYSPLYWMFVEVSSNGTLGNLDSFLRNIWLECCWHLSIFTIAGRTYGSEGTEGSADYSMDIKFSRILRDGLSFNYEYDFGSTTELTIRVVDKRKGILDTGTVLLVARNEPPEMVCDICKTNKATVICQECFYSGYYPFLCDECVDKHDCDEDRFLPVVNSPRMGVCGYTGED